MRGGVVVVVFVKVEERSADKIPNLFSHPVLCPSCLIFFGFFHFVMVSEVGFELTKIICRNYAVLETILLIESTTVILF